MKTILVDMDGVINDFQQHFKKYIKKLGYGYDSSGDLQYHSEYGILGKDNNSISKKEQKAVSQQIMLNPEFWIDLPVKKGAQECLKWMDKKYNLFIATTPYRFSDTYTGVKVDWLKQYFPFIQPDQILFSKSKWDLEGDAIIEDKPETLEKCKEVGMYTIAFDQKYNASVKVDYRLHSWNLSELKKVLENI